jgi:hypothetical protein
MFPPEIWYEIFIAVMCMINGKLLSNMKIKLEEATGLGPGTRIRVLSQFLCSQRLVCKDFHDFIDFNDTLWVNVMRILCIISPFAKDFTTAKEYIQYMLTPYKYSTLLDMGLRPETYDNYDEYISLTASEPYYIYPYYSFQKVINVMQEHWPFDSLTEQTLQFYNTTTGDFSQALLMNIFRYTLVYRILNISKHNFIFIHLVSKK